MRDVEIQGGFSNGDELFKLGKYRAAAKSYYELFYCGHGTELNPRVSEAGNVYSEFEAAMILAVDGGFDIAAARLHAIKRELPPFTEAGYLAGIFEWAHGDHALARRSWKATVMGTRFAEPPDSIPNTDAAQIAARKMLQWSLNK